MARWNGKDDGWSSARGECRSHATDVPALPVYRLHSGVSGPPSSISARIRMECGALGLSLEPNDDDGEVLMMMMTIMLMLLVVATMMLMMMMRMMMTTRLLRRLAATSLDG